MGKSLEKVKEIQDMIEVMLIPFIESGKYDIPKDAKEFVFETKKLAKQIIENNTEIPKYLELLIIIRNLENIFFKYIKNF